MKRLHPVAGEPATYAANEGISLLAIKDAIEQADLGAGLDSAVS
jgi:hypothetical protein